MVLVSTRRPHGILPVIVTMLVVGWTGGALSQEATQPPTPAAVATPAASPKAASGAATIDCNAPVTASKVGGASFAQNPTASQELAGSLWGG
jgi:hypothetical protein